MTFGEAFEHTGRKINISVSPSEVHQSSRLLNAVTSPNVCIREAVMASCAVPGVFPAVTLMAKNARGERLPYVASRKWVDGSIADDLPAKRLARLVRRQSLHHQPDQPDRAVGRARFRRRRQSRVETGRRLPDRDEGMAESATYPFAMTLVKRVVSVERLRAHGVQRRDAGLHRRHQHHSEAPPVGSVEAVVACSRRRRRDA